ncbi:hypothetical protein [Dyadobacter sp. CY356]|uniref:hypothetical protein n=1 Tax=Dyadobacter sp. CY356 TaxID=2906442 RepID=UPI001F2F8E24|nr:hypothetical protein [Dyadobacter sp. CY356]MCF0057474.1 hypothetical protein [Dyadobacter sp. CY356]
MPFHLCGWAFFVFRFSMGWNPRLSYRSCLVVFYGNSAIGTYDMVAAEFIAQFAIGTANVKN